MNTFNSEHFYDIANANLFVSLRINLDAHVNKFDAAENIYPRLFELNRSSV